MQISMVHDLRIAHVPALQSPLQPGPGPPQGDRGEVLGGEM